jgi:cyclohexyl-isocyanide hydratase
MPSAQIDLVAKTLDPVRSDRGLAILPTTTIAACPPLDLVCVPGGPGTNDTMEDREILDFLRRTAAHARYVTSVCAGSLTLAAAGLLRGKRAACHWMSRDLLRRFGAEPAAERVVVDGKFISGGGVTAGVDFALALVAQLQGREAAEAIQLMVEYDPHPPFDAGTPERASPSLVASVRERAISLMRERTAAVSRAAAALGVG